MDRNWKIAISFVVAGLLLVARQLPAGTTGKIAGTVRDAGSGTPLPGANIIVEGTLKGAAADAEGHYYISNLPPGTYKLRASVIGYQVVVVEDVRVSIDLTTEVDFSLEESVLESAETIVVVAEKPLVQKDMTAKMAVLSGETISEKLPVTSLNEVLATQAGFVQDENGTLHARGGRAGEISYMIDGTLIQNPFDRGVGVELEVESIQELEVLSGTFNAEYGNAMSAIVNVVTRDGDESYGGKLQYESSMLNDSPYHKKDWLLDENNVGTLPTEQQAEYLDAVRDSLGSSLYQFVSVLDDPHVESKAVLPVTGTFSGQFNGPVPAMPKLKFFISGRFGNENSPLPYGYELLRSANGKLSYPLTPTAKLTYRTELSQIYEQPYDHAYKYYRANEASQQGSYPIEDRRKVLHALQLSHAINSSTFYTLQGSWFSTKEDVEVPDRAVVTDPETGQLVSSDYVTRTYFRGVEGSFRIGDVRYWDKTETSTLNLKADITSQIHKRHQVKGGVEWKRHDIFRHRIGMPPRGQLEYFDKQPVEFGAYVQDKLEYDFMILNIGMRFDYVDPSDSYYPEPGDALQRVVENGETAIVTVPQEPVPARSQVSPRIGLAHPITDETVLHFAYGHFFQFPRYYDIYRNDDLEDILANDALVGNPGLEPEKTVSFEVGLKQQIGTDMALDLTAYTRDVENLVSSFFYFSEGRGYTIFTNADFGRIQGVDLTLSKRAANYFSGQLNYSFSVARGNESDPLEGFNSFREEDAHLRPNRDFYLDFDRRHDMSANFDFRFPQGFGPRILGFLPFENSGLNVLFELASGLPYTPTSRDGADATLNPEKNSARKPWTSSLDLRLNKDFYLGRFRTRAFLKVENLLDRKNVLRVWTRTGEAWDQGPTSILPKDRQANPENVGQRRTIRLGFFVDF